ncbi:vacuolar protein sorting-associated protein 11 homolog [Drosophila simulans]|uniref:RING-type domain-containing protein n=1 Tax=Drosophila simulans TaxID=7240 RepID=A0A0J9S1M5_DROSI|nr:vacuolar protein sorting-associated protein 11 homolog [Drosophila simulans]KMZ01285.1 uncharacterized protein Dsimw501_GD27396 [Drosophila simulans]KMZ01287.1 uncharacterized protein Dsimw501_GD29324 [Drosophila simulans]
MDISVLEWKKVDLFNIIAVPFVKIPNTAEISCYCFPESKSSTEERNIKLVICDRNGNILTYFSNWDCITFKSPSNRKAIALCSLTSNNSLATVTPDTNNGIHIEVFDLNRLTKKQAAPIIASAYTQPSSTPLCLNADVIDDKLFALAIGLGNGDILLHYGKITKNFSTNIRQHTVSGNAVNGIHFDFKTQPLDTTQTMFVTCVQGVYCFMLKEKSIMDTKFVLDNDKGNLNYRSVMRKAGDCELNDSMLVVGRADAVYCYTPEGRGPCFAIEGAKECLAWVGHYLIVGVKNLKQNVTTLIVLDTENKIIVFQKQFQELFYVISETNFCYVVTNSRDANACDILMLEQNSIDVNIRLLVEKNMYNIALRLLHREGYNSTPEMALVRFQYGNHLLQKGDISRATQEFIKTIGFIKPYAVISKLLYSRYNTFLLNYLSEWKKKNEPSSCHTRLIECCSKREQIKHEMQQDDSKHYKSPAEINHHLSTISKMYFACSLSNQLTVPVEEEHLLHQLLEYGPASLAVDLTTYLNNITFENAKESKNILSFCSILADHNDYCAKMLAKIIEAFPVCDEKLLFYLLVFYFKLWQVDKVSSSFVSDFIKTHCLRLDKTIIVSRLYTFFNVTQRIHRHQINTGTLHNETIDKCDENLTKNNANVALNGNLSKRSFLMMLKSSCSNEEIKAIKIKPIFTDGLMRSVVDSANELKLVENFNEKIKRSRSTLSLYTNNPIEFRNDKCDICHEMLSTQSIYFLCQHSFHRECLNYKSTKRKEKLLCIICKTRNLISPKHSSNFCCDSSDTIAALAKIVSIGNKLETKLMIGGRPKSDGVTSSNPFD